MGRPVDANPTRLVPCEQDGAALSDEAAHLYAPTFAAGIDPSWSFEADGVSAAIIPVSLRRQEYVCGFLHRTFPTEKMIGWQPLALAALAASGEMVGLSLDGARLLCPELLAHLEAWYGESPRQISSTGGYDDVREPARRERARRRSYHICQAQLAAIFHTPLGSRRGQKFNKRATDVSTNAAILCAG